MLSPNSEDPKKSIRPSAIDGKLLREIESAGDDGMVTGCFTFNRGADPENILAQVSAKVTEIPVTSQILKNIGSAVVTASGKFLSQLIARPEVASAMTSGNGEEWLIHPTNPIQLKPPSDI